MAAGTERSAAREGRHQQRYAHRRATLRGRCTRKGWRRNGNGLAAWGATSTGRPEQASTRFPLSGYLRLRIPVHPLRGRRRPGLCRRVGSRSVDSRGAGDPYRRPPKDSARPHKGDPGSDPLNSLFADTRLGGDKLSTLKNATVDEVKTNLWDNPEGRAAAIAFLGATLGILAATALSYAWTTAEASETARERIVPHPSEATGVPLATGANVPNMKLADEVDTQHDKNRAIPAATTLLLQRLASGFRRSDRSNKGD